MLYYCQKSGSEARMDSWVYVIAKIEFVSIQHWLLSTLKDMQHDILDYWYWYY